jgi:xanthine dehydrogenase YagS FAD-binding subunit
MNPFEYQRATDVADAIDKSEAAGSAHYLGGGTNLVDLMREGIETPDVLVDVTKISRDIVAHEDGSILIGAGATNTAIAADQSVRDRFPLLSRAILSGASGQIRNMATAAGNLMQRTRCQYFYDEASRCNKRSPGVGCDAIEGFNRMHAILGAATNSCIATHPSDMCVALAALDAVVHLQGTTGTRKVPLIDFHLLPGNHPENETQLAEDELITAIELPALSFAKNSTYRKVRDRSSYAFALVSVGAALELCEGKVSNVRLALGGVAHKPWRAAKAEASLLGAAASIENFRIAAEMEMADATTFRDNAFKPELGRRLMVAVLSELAEKTR